MIYLCADSGRYITGITLSVDAGLVVRWWGTTLCRQSTGPFGDGDYLHRRTAALVVGSVRAV